MTVFPRVLELLRERGAADIMVFGGGIVPPGDAAELEAAGVAGVFGPGTSVAAIVSFLMERLRPPDASCS